MVSPNLNQFVLARFDKCPNKDCQSENSLMRSLVKKEIKAGKMEEDEAQPAWLMQTAVAMNPMKPPLIGSIIQTGTGVLDICLDCGNVFALVITKAEQIYSPGPMPGMEAFGNPR